MQKMDDDAWAHYVHAINSMFATQYIDASAVAAVVKHLPKKANSTKEERQHLTSWRPILLLPVPTKIATGLLMQRMGMDEHYTSTSQKGWQRGVSCAMS